MPIMPFPLDPGVDPRRRELMALALTVPVAMAGSLWLVAPVASRELTLPTPGPSPRPRGYHTSRHIETYYGTLRY